LRILTRFRNGSTLIAFRSLSKWGPLVIRYFS
jgi:hypothetical protein